MCPPHDPPRPAAPPNPDRDEANDRHARAARELQIRTAQLELIDRQLALVCWTTDSELRLTSVFGTGIPDLPSDPQPYLGQPVHAYFATAGVPEALREQSEAAHRLALTGARSAYQRALGGQLAAVQVEPLRDSAGQITGCVGAMLPLTAPIRLLHELQSSHDRLQTLTAQLLNAQETERRAIARELHDQIGQELTIMTMQLQDLVSAEPAQLPAHVEEVIATIDQVLAKVRTLALDLRPSQLDDLGLDAALRWYFERHCSHARLHLHLDLTPPHPRAPAAVETTCFRIAQEAMTNILRSAQASQVWVTLASDGAGLTLTVRDDGRGFDVAAAHAQAMQNTSLGLLGMEERAAQIGGRCSIESAPGQGATVRVWLPLPPAGAPPEAMSDH
ncbi:sensor histidine kinase [Oscillochloris sp. ZM17-4]|uniref:sensor histidine kinase n=1 Tax=Oscillochloris sp. ZM17-4 TaxID=2866714 RepID=UPI001C73CEAE|nr:sensor histidine kinase [Oscillochloris sp. ZM17-4]MBX0328335.1 sensor histidine kinase [Oscillochloris sp. ZM17-4]